MVGHSQQPEVGTEQRQFDYDRNRKVQVGTSKQECPQAVSCNFPHRPVSPDLQGYVGPSNPPALTSLGAPDEIRMANRRM